MVGADAVVLSYGMDGTAPVKMLEEWLTRLKEIELKTTYIMGCKSDLITEEHREIGEWASKHSMRHFQTSAKTGEKVEHTLTKILEECAEGKLKLLNSKWQPTIFKSHSSKDNRKK